jgi:hypothetical protein
MINNTYFNQNHAEIQGGSITYNRVKPIIDEETVIFMNNIAPYGKDLSSYPFKLNFLLS